MRQRLTLTMMGRIAGAAALLCAVASAAPTNPRPTQLLFATTNAPYQLAATNTLPKRADWAPVYKAWRASFSPRSAPQTQAALELLVNGHPDFVAYALPKLRSADGPLADLPPNVQSAIANSAAISFFRLREWTTAPFVDEVHDAVRQHSDSWVPHLIGLLDDFEHLPEPAVVALLDLLESGQIADPAGKAAFEDALLRAGELGPSMGRLQSWRSKHGRDAPELRLFAMAALARAGQPLQDSEYVELIQTKRATFVRSALRAVRSRPLSEPLMTAVAQNFFGSTDLETWRDGFAVLKAQKPDILDAAYRTLTQDQAGSWPPEVLAAFVEAAPAWATPRLAKFGYEQPALGACRDVPLAAAVLERKATMGTSIAAALIPYGKPRLTDCRETLIAAFRAAPLVSADLNAAADMALQAGQAQTAADFADLGARLNAGAAPTRFWANFQAGFVADTVNLRILQSIQAPPDAALSAIAASVTADPESDRADSALLALAAHDGVSRFPGAFSAALNAKRSSSARTAAALLVEAYARRPTLAPPDEEVVENVGMRTDVDAAMAAALMASLATRGPPFDASWADRQNKPTGETCAPLMIGGPLHELTAINLLNQAYGDPGLNGDALKVCVLTVTGKRDPIRELAAISPSSTLNNPADSAVRLWRVNAVSASKVFKENSNRQLQEAVEGRKRDLIGSLTASLAAGLPVAVLMHLALWVVLLSIYPHSPAVQSVVFWNPFVRRLLGLGYIDVVLINVPWARRRLLQPFRASLLGDILRPAANQLDRIDYYPESRVVPLQAGATEVEPATVVEALSRHNGRLVLLGQSGLGKSSFLRFWLAHRAVSGRDEIVYLRADECRGGVEAEIERRMQSLGQDQKLVHALIYAGRLFVYIDGYNEVEVTTQDAITRFLADHPYGNILVCTQIPLRGFTGAPGWRLLPLNRDQAATFLRTRAAVIPPDAPLTGGVFESAAAAFIKHAWPVSEPVQQGFAEVLSNPMDLTSVALLLARGRTPDLFALEAQQFDSLERALKSLGLEFRLRAFSAALLKQRLADQENLETLGFGPEVAALANAKMAVVRTFADDAGRVVGQETRFRHDRIRDFFTHFAFLDLDLGVVAEHAADARFAGVYAFLARSLASSEAEDLRERLIRQAAELDDHRVSDSFVREFDWRRRFGANAPAWLARFDLPEATAADAEFKAKLAQRQYLQLEIEEARERVGDSRRLTTILLAADSRTLLDRAALIYRRAGADLAPSSNLKETLVRLVDPVGQPFTLAAVAQAERIEVIHVQLALAQLREAPGRKVLVTNASVASAPDARVPDLNPVLVQLCQNEGVWPIEAKDLYDALLDAVREGRNADWGRISPVFKEVHQ